MDKKKEDQGQDGISKYFANKEDKECASILIEKATNWYDKLENLGYIDKLRNMFAAYHGANTTSVGEAHQITFAGDQGELVEINVNNFRNLAEHMLTMTTSTRPTMEARATNTDSKSLVQTQLANGILDYYMRDRKYRLEDKLKLACEYGIVLGSGYVKMAWNATAGNVVNQEEMDNASPTEKIMPEYEGDIEFINLSALDVIMDLSKEGYDHDWILCRSYLNRFDLIAKYPEREKDILNIPVKDHRYDVNIGTSLDREETDDIPVYEFYHKKTAAVPEGKYMFFASENSVFYEGALPYRRIPVYRLSPSQILGTPLGYSNMFDVLPLQDASNVLMSAAFTNQSAFGVQNILNPQGSNIDVNQLSSGLNIIDYNPGAGKPEPLQLTKTPPEIFNMIGMLNEYQETISGINSVVRGNPEANLRSGSAIAMIQSNAIQFMSGLQSSYIHLIEDVGLGLVEMLVDFAQYPRIANIVGESKRSYVKEFIGDDLSDISRVVVDVANPLTKCLEKGTKVLMHNGSLKNIEEIEIGEKVMGPDSEERTVANIGSGFETMYKIRSKDKKRKIEYGTNESHILTLRYCSDDKSRGFKKGEIKDVTVKDYLELPKYHQNVLQGFKTGIEFPKKELPIPSYIMGAWLGGGHSRTTAITTMDDEILKEWTDYSESLGLNIRSDENSNTGKAKTYHITSGLNGGISKKHNSFMRDLRELELIKNKHIPQMYLTSSREQRLELLAGLLDTDGTLISETFVITQKSDILTKNIQYLAESLGFRVTHKKIEVSTNFTNDDKTYFTNKVTIGGNTDTIPTRLERKQAQYKEKARNWLNYGIEIECVGEGEYFGIVLKEEPHFVLGDFTVTHNTIAGRVQMADNLLQYQQITPDQYFAIINSGKLEAGIEEKESQLVLIKAENEGFLKGDQATATVLDQHRKHIIGHRAVVDDPELRKNPEQLALVLEHINVHIQMLKTTDPMVLQLTGEEPLQEAPMDQQAGGQAPSEPSGNAEIQQAPQTLEPVESQMLAVPGIEQNIRLPEGVNPEEVPLTPEDNLMINQGIPTIPEGEE